ncbi:unnamed protein product [Ceutorhynchus assimilis]|uniref:Uncharacterized protein n=1 Tax=Ceutorhynchus assimilis TaxID=467358 RepID=A0A9N9MSD9_9CUCU|nr:unnamed protein product [Ceutorhynchus assimilis]
MKDIFAGVFDTQKLKASDRRSSVTIDRRLSIENPNTDLANSRHVAQRCNSLGQEEKKRKRNETAINEGEICKKKLKTQKYSPKIVN